MRTSGKRLLAGCFIILLLTLLAAAGVAQVGVDPRNTSDEYLDAVDGAACYAHHGGEGFRPFDFFFEDYYTELPVGEDVEIVITVRHPSIPPSMDNPQEFVEDIAITVNTTEARNVRVLTDDAPDDLELAYEARVASGQTHEEIFQLFPGAEGGQVTARLVAVEPAPQEVHAGEWTVTFGGRPLEGDGDERSLELNADALRAIGQGERKIETTWTHPLDALPLDWTATIEIEAAVYYGQEATEFVFRTDRPLQSARQPVASVDFVIPVRMLSEDPALIDFRIEGVTFWEHQPGDGAPLDRGLFYRFITMQVTGGDELVIGAAPVAPTPGAAVDVYNLFTRLLGMIGLFLVVATTVTGGVFGRKSRRWLNRFTGGAKKRVLWHSAAGFLIIVVATLHFAIALLDVRNDVSKGLFWGGTAWVLLLSLGFTGYYQVRMIKRWNYRVWRHVHLWSAVGVLLFLLVHFTLDGSDFGFVRDVLPDWYERLIWPRAPGGAPPPPA